MNRIYLPFSLSYDIVFCKRRTDYKRFYLKEDLIYEGGCMMRAFVNFGTILLLVLLAGVIVIVYRFLKNSDPDSLEKDPDVSEEEFEKEKKKMGISSFFSGKGKSTEKQATVLVNMPILSWKYPGGEWESRELSKVCTSIGRDADCDIVLNHPTVSMKHAEIVMKMRKVQAEKKGARYFLLKNHSKENPISFLNSEGGADDWRDIVRSIPLIYSENAFFLGLVEMRISFPVHRRVLSEGPKLWEQNVSCETLNPEREVNAAHESGISQGAGAGCEARAAQEAGAGREARAAQEARAGREAGSAREARTARETGSAREADVSRETPSRRENSWEQVSSNAAQMSQKSSTGMKKSAPDSVVRSAAQKVQPEAGWNLQLEQPEQIVDPELVQAQRKVIRRSPRSRNRI